MKSEDKFILRFGSQAGYKGFTLIELVITIVILSIASLAVIAPLLISSRGIGSGGAAMGMQMAAKAQEYAEIISGDLTDLSENEWSTLLSRSVATSPITVSDVAVLNGKSFGITEFFTCVEENLKTTDTSCGKGFALIVVTVTNVASGKNFSLNFIKTRTGI